MGFITDRQYLDFQHREDVRRIHTVSAEDFKDKTDRTLTISKSGPFSSDNDESFRHIFLKKGGLHLHIYKIKETGEFESSSWRQGDLRTSDVEPKTLRGSSVTYFEFATVMENLHAPIQFYAVTSGYGKLPELEKNFFGLTKPSWADTVEF